MKLNLWLKVNVKVSCGGLGVVVELKTVRRHQLVSERQRGWEGCNTDTEQAERGEARSEWPGASWTPSLSMLHNQIFSLQLERDNEIKHYPSLFALYLHNSYELFYQQFFFLEIYYKLWSKYQPINHIYKDHKASLNSLYFYIIIPIYEI